MFMGFDYRFESAHLVSADERVNIYLNKSELPGWPSPNNLPLDDITCIIILKLQMVGMLCS